MRLSWRSADPEKAMKEAIYSVAQFRQQKNVPAHLVDIIKKMEKGSFSLKEVMAANAKDQVLADLNKEYITDQRLTSR